MANELRTLRTRAKKLGAGILTHRTSGKGLVYTVTLPDADNVNCASHEEITAALNAFENPAPVAEVAEAAPAPKKLGKRAQMEAAARGGAVPHAPDFSKPSHKAWLKKRAEIVALVEARDLKALKALEIPTYSSSPKALARYRDLAVMAMEA